MRTLLVVTLVAACSGPSKPPQPAPVAPPTARPAALIAPDPFAAQNLGFEQVDGNAPRAWESRSDDALVAVTDEKHGGQRSLRLDVVGRKPRTARTSFDATPYRGKHVRVHGYIKTTDASGAALWLRADRDDQPLVFDGMEDRRITGTAAWTKVSVEVDVPREADKLVIGGLVFGAATGTAWFDDLSIAVEDIKPPAQLVVAGTVLAPDGSPVGDAIVGLIGQRGEIVEHVRSDEAGRFRFSLLEGTYGFSAHRAGAVGGFVALAKLTGSTNELEIKLGSADGVTVKGTIKGKVAPNLMVQVAPLSQNDADIFAIPVAANGTFEAVLPRGDKYFATVIGTSEQDQFDRKGDRVDIVLEVPSLDPPPDAVVAYIANHGIPLASAEAGTGFDDMARIGKLVGKARVVALGEATHGTREFFQLKHRFLEYLVAKQGFSVFAIEANQPECRKINDYVLHGKGTAKEALAGIYFWTWNTEEVLAMIEWMRAWNADAKHKTKVQFTGFDMQTTTVAYDAVAAAVTAVSAENAKALLAPIAILGDPGVHEQIKQLSDADKKALMAGLDALVPLLAKADADTRHDLRVLQQAAVMMLEPLPYVARDRAMAENIGWLLDTTKAKIVVWAHNGHISNTLPSFANMGKHLRAKYKRAYVNIGFVFGEGSFQALDFSKPGRPLGEHTLGPPPQHHSSVAFSRTGKPLLVLDLRALPKRGIVRDWFWAKHPVRDTGAAFIDEKSMTQQQVLPELYDAVIYVDKTTRARPIKKT